MAVPVKETPSNPRRCSRNCCPLPKGTKRTTGRIMISNSDRRRSESATVFILTFRPAVLHLPGNKTPACKRPSLGKRTGQRLKLIYKEKAPPGGAFFITAGAIPRPTLNYRRGAPMCAPVIHGTGFIPLSSKPSVLPPSPLGRLNKIHLPLGKGGLPSGKAFIK